MKKIFSFFLTLLSAITSLAQVNVVGLVRDTKGNPVEFLNVVLISESDTSTIVSGSVTDLQGVYRLSNAQFGNYYIVASAVGYKTVKRAISLNFPPFGNEIKCNFIVEGDDLQLDEVTAYGSRKSESAGKTSYIFTAEQVASSSNGAELICHTKELHIDPLSGKIANVSTSAGAPMILINGVRATDEDLKAIPPSKIIKCEYYSIPPARYAYVSSVINVTTKSLDDGWNAGLDAMSAVATGFVNGSAYFRYSHGNHQFGLDYGINFRDYDDRKTTTTYDFLLGTDAYHYDYETKDHFGYTDQTLSLKYTYNKGNGTVFQVKCSPGYFTNFNNGDQSIGVKQDTILEQAVGITQNDGKSFGPSVDLYFTTKIGDKRSLDINLVGTYFGNDQNSSNAQTLDNGSQLLSDDMEQETDKFSVIAEAAYSRQFSGSTSTTIGYRGQVAKSQSSISNSLSNGETYDYNSDNYQHYAYAEFQTTKGGLSARLSAGVTFLGAENDDESYSRCLFSPVVSFMYRISQSQYLGLKYKLSSEAPTISDLSKNASLKLPNVVSKGTPGLKSSTEHIVALIYNFSSRYVDFSVMPACYFDKNSIATGFEQGIINDDEYLILNKVNSNYTHFYGGYFNAQYRPLGNDKLSIKLDGVVGYQEQSVPTVGFYSGCESGLDFDIDITPGRWGISYQGNILTWAADGAYESTPEPKSHLSCFYKLGAFKFKANVLWLGSLARYKSCTVENDLFQSSSLTKIYNNQSMFTIGFSVDFGAGKKHSLFEEKLSNSDTDRGMF